MNYSEFKTILAKSKRKIGLIGLFITLFSILLLFVNKASEGSTAGYIIIGLMLLIGLIMMISFKDLIAIKSDEYPLLKAIKEHQSDFVIWMYQKQITSTVEGINAGTSNNLIVCTKNDKMHEIVLGKKTSPADLINYLHTEFPEALIGFTDENKTAVNKILGKKA